MNLEHISSTAYTFVRCEVNVSMYWSEQYRVEYKVQYSIEVLYSADIETIKNDVLEGTACAKVLVLSLKGEVWWNMCKACLDAGRSTHSSSRLRTPTTPGLCRL